MCKVKVFDTRWTVSSIVMMINESVGTGSSSCYCDRQGFDIKIKQQGFGDQVGGWMFRFIIGSAVLHLLLKFQVCFMFSVKLKFNMCPFWIAIGWAVTCASV